MRDEKIKNVIAQLNPELLLSEIEHRIRGEKKIYSGGVGIVVDILFMIEGIIRIKRIGSEYFEVKVYPKKR